ncbi:MAG: alanine--tRNA ligase, partial [Lachnospiraceae bacterium]|nr:alanine--tRNA ligase [Lachnospiraceae bacterium]
YPSVYVDDDEAFNIWKDKMHIAPERIFRFGKEDNFWEHGSGPCGPCSEIYYDRGEKYGCGKPDCTVGCDCDRYMEVWNIVFSQFDNDGKGNYSELEQKNIDTGMGLERLAVAVQDVDSIFDVDTLHALRSEVCKKAGTEYGVKYENDVSIRIITDHIRSTTFMISDGILPSNEGRGYVLRRLIRRACRHGRLLGISDDNFLTELAKVVIRDSKDGYPELEEKKDFILKVISQEEEKFERTIDIGLSLLKEMTDRLKKDGGKTLSGADAFRLYDTYGFPLDITKEILEEEGLGVDEDGYNEAMKKQSDTARSARKKSNYMGADATVYEQLDAAVNSEFIGYDKTEAKGRIVALCLLNGKDGDKVADALFEGQEGAVITDRTPFYGTMGGQVGDSGVIELDGALFEVMTTEHVAGSKIAHIGKVIKGSFKDGDEVTLKVDEASRTATCRNHSATHLLQKALRDVLGTHVEQSGSYQDKDKTRFDFSHFEAMTKDELKKVEKEINEKIAEGIPVVTEVLTIEEAKKTGAMALFGEKYGEKVRVVEMGEFSKEFCGGTHVKNTRDIVTFKILSETGIAAGVRRIEAITGDNVLKYYREVEQRLENAAAAAKTTPEALSDRIGKLLEEVKALKSENESLKAQAAKDAVGDVTDNIQDINGVSLIATKVKGVDMNGLRDLSDELKTKLKEGVVVLLSETEGKVSIVVSATEQAMAKGAHAGNLIKEIAGLVGGGGGGRPNMAQAGGKNPAGMDDAIKKASEVLASQIK